MYLRHIRIFVSKQVSQPNLERMKDVSSDNLQRNLVPKDKDIPSWRVGGRHIQERIGPSVTNRKFTK